MKLCLCPALLSGFFLLLTFGCSTLPVASPNPPVAAATAAPSISPVTPTPNVLGVGETVSQGQWNITVTALRSFQSVKDSLHRFTAKEGNLVLVVGTTIENTSSSVHSLAIDVVQLNIADQNGERHTALGAGLGPPSDSLNLLFPVTGSGSSTTTRDGVAISFSFKFTESSKSLSVGVPGAAKLPLSLAFVAPVDASSLTLQWPGLPPIDLGAVPGL